MIDQDKSRANNLELFGLFKNWHYRFIGLTDSRFLFLRSAGVLKIGINVGLQSLTLGFPSTGKTILCGHLLIKRRQGFQYIIGLNEFRIRLADTRQQILLKKLIQYSLCWIDCKCKQILLVRINYEIFTREIID